LSVTNWLLALSFNTNQAIKDILAHGGRILVVVFIAVIAARLINGLVGPLLRIVIREHMLEEPRIEVDKRIETLSLVISRTVATALAVFVGLTALPEIGLDIAPL